jgi:hypothetical protein
MKQDPSDTPPSVHSFMVRGYRHMRPSQKLAIVCELSRSMQQLALARLRQQYRDVSERELRLHLMSLSMDRETLKRLFHWDPPQKDS